MAISDKRVVPCGPDVAQLVALDPVCIIPPLA